MKKHKEGMRSPTMPKDHFEHDEGRLNPTSKLKYATEFGNPEDLDRSTEGLANYVKKNRMKY